MGSDQSHYIEVPMVNNKDKERVSTPEIKVFRQGAEFNIRR